MKFIPGTTKGRFLSIPALATGLILLFGSLTANPAKAEPQDNAVNAFALSANTIAAINSDLETAGVIHPGVQVDLVFFVSRLKDFGNPITGNGHSALWIGYNGDNISLTPIDASSAIEPPTANDSWDLLDLEKIQLMRYGLNPADPSVNQNVQMCATNDNQTFCFKTDDLAAP
jgi:hypothetical protein